MSDIAKRAGVSLSTVSYALSGKRAISEETKRRVFEAIDEMDFHPHALGRALASKRTNTIALLYPAAPHGLSEMPLEFVTSAAEAARQRGYAFLLSTSPPEDAETLRMIRQGFVDGLILMEIKLHDPRVDMLKARNYPFTMIGHCRHNDGISFVDLDFAHALRTAVHYLADLGHRHIAFINREAALYEAGYGPSVRSREGFCQAVAERGLSGIAYPTPSTPQGGYDAFQTLLTTHPKLSAIVMLNRDAIGGVVQAIYDRDLRIPDDLSLVAVVSPSLAELITPTLTTMDFPVTEMGRMGAELLIRQLEGGEPEPIQCLLEAKLTVRQSSGPHSGRTER